MLILYFGSLMISIKKNLDSEPWWYHGSRKDRIFVKAVKKAFWRPVQSLSFYVARVGKGDIVEEEGSILGEYGKSLTKEKCILITSFKYSNRESYKTWEVLECETEDVKACGGEQIQWGKRGCF